MKANRSPFSPYRMLLAVAIPLAAFVLQSAFWAAIRPYVWFLFFPAVFFSSWVAGFSGGLVATVLSTLLVWWYFIPPTHTFALESPMTLFSIAMFAFMGVLFSISHDRLRKANRQAAEALATAHSANEKITLLLEKTKELDELKTRFFANVSHELRTPLTLILGPAGKLLAMEGLDGGMRRDLEVIERNARQLYRHVSDLLDVAKLEAGRAVMRYSQADLAQLARLIASNFESLAAEKSIRFTVDAPGDLPAQVDVEKCQRIILNLLSNAFKFTPDGGAITLGLKNEKGQAALHVSDNGPGIPANMHEEVFERFRQVEGGAQRHFGGTGLGLAIIKDFVELHNGTISISNVPGGGVVFTVTLPLNAPVGIDIHTDAGRLDKELEHQALDELSIHPGIAAPNGAAGAPLILVVEDNSDMSAYIGKILARHFRVVSAFDGEEGLAKALALHPALIVSDIMMPGMSGDQMVNVLRIHPEMADTPVVLLTAKMDDALRVKLLQKGVQEFLTKPFLEEELLAVVGRLIAERKAVEAERVLMQTENARLAAAVNCAADAMVVTDAEGNIEYANPAFEKITGYRLDEVLGRNPRVLKSGRHDRTYYEELWRTIKTGRVWRGRIVNRKKDGSLYEEEMTISPITDSAGAIINFVAVKRDVTREVALDKSRAYFTDITAHELRTPLTKLHLVESMLKQVEAEVSGRERVKDVRNTLRESMAAFDRIVNVTTLISDMTRTGAEKPLVMDFIYFDITTALENAQANIGEARRNISVETDLAGIPRQAVVLGNRGMIQQALDEVLSNAIKFSPDGKALRVRAHADGSSVHIEVADEGEGIPEDKLQDVLVPYYALESSLMHSTGRYKFHGGGLGLGLTIVKLIMEYHNGTLTIGNRTDGTGTLVALRFPLAGDDIQPVSG